MKSLQRPSFCLRNFLKLSHAKDNVEVISDLKIYLIGGHSIYQAF